VTKFTQEAVTGITVYAKKKLTAEYTERQQI